MIGISQAWSLRNASTMFRWKPIVMIRLKEINCVIDDAHVTLLVDVVQQTATTRFSLVAVILHSQSQKLLAMIIQILRFLGVVDGIVLFLVEMCDKTKAYGPPR